MKTKIKNKAQKEQIDAQMLMRNYMLERMLVRISKSKYRHSFILKGGFLIGSLIGVDKRTTMDIDTTITGTNVSSDMLKTIFLDLCALDIGDHIQFKFQNIEEIREEDDYPGFRIAIVANLQTMAIPIKVDITTGDIIIPKEIHYKHKLMFEEEEISILSYPIETLLAEKIQTIYYRGVFNTRARDFYDVYMLSQLEPSRIDYDLLRKALTATCNKRNTPNIMRDYIKTLEFIRTNEEMRQIWSNYQNKTDYTNNLSFDEACDALHHLLTLVYTNPPINNSSE